MTDPAVDAAQRACGPHGVSHFVGPGRYALRGAREMAAPLRELHQPIVLWKYDDVNGVWDDEHGEKIVIARWCRECTSDEALEDLDFGEGVDPDLGAHWPCPTAGLIYSSDELGDTP